MSRYKAYPSYKDSGVEWLGKVPSEWKLCQLKFMARIKNGQDYKRVEADEGYPVIGSGGQFSYASQFTYDKASVLLGRKGTIDRPLYINEPFWTVDTMYYTEVNEDVDPKFLYYLALTIQFSRYATNTALPSMTQENLGNYVFAIPTDSDGRKKIAAFLDHETAKIDALIEKQQRLIELLKEKRQAVISHAVTKGLNPNAPMKDSGVEWLGEVPAHWEVKCIRHVIDAIGDVDHFMPPSVEKGVPYLMTGDLKDCISEVSLDDCKQVSHSDYKELSKRIKTSKGDVVMARYATIGTLMYVDVDVEMLVSYSCVTLKTNQSKMMGRYLFQYMKSDAFRQGVEHRVNTNTQGNVGIKDLQGVNVAVPPSDEQAAIAAFLASENLKMDALNDKAQSATALLKERRTALISAAVTGKIDVRDWQAAAAQEEVGVEC